LCSRAKVIERAFALFAHNTIPRVVGDGVIFALRSLANYLQNSRKATKKNGKEGAATFLRESRMKGPQQGELPQMNVHFNK